MLWKYMNRVVFSSILDADGMLVAMELTPKRKGEYQDVRVIVHGKLDDCARDGRIDQLRPHLCDETNKNTGEGLLQCLLFARRSLKRYRDEGPCPACRSSNMAGYPVQKLKAIGMPRCEKCTFTAVIGASEGACKRARHSR